MDPELPKKWEEYKAQQEANPTPAEPIQLRNKMPEPKTEEVVDAQPKPKPKVEKKAPQ